MVKGCQYEKVVCFTYSLQWVAVHLTSLPSSNRMLKSCWPLSWMDCMKISTGECLLVWLLLFTVYMSAVYVPLNLTLLL